MGVDQHPHTMNDLIYLRQHAAFFVISCVCAKGCENL